MSVEKVRTGPVLMADRYGDSPPARTVVVSEGIRSPREPSSRALLARVITAIAIAFLTLGAISAGLTRNAAESQALGEAVTRHDIIADTIVMRALASGLYSEEEDLVQMAGDKLDEEVAAIVDGEWLVLLNLWNEDDGIFWSDDPSLVGQSFAAPQVWDATVDDIEGRTIVGADVPEHQNIRGYEPLVEIYSTQYDAIDRPVLVETHTSKATLDARANELWAQLSIPILVAMLALALVLLPVLWIVLRRAQRRREERLERRLDALRDERRRVAGQLHDGAVQDLAAATLVMVGLAGRAQRAGDPTLGDDLRGVADRVRQAARDQRELLGDLYPMELTGTGLGRALELSADAARAAGIDVRVDVDGQAVTALGPREQEMIRRVAEELLRNIAKHSDANAAAATLRRDRDCIVLQIADNGIGFDPGRLTDPKVGHLGTRVVGDLAREAGAELLLRTGDGAGTVWRLTIQPTEI